MVHLFPHNSACFLQASHLVGPDERKPLLPT